MRQWALIGCLDTHLAKSLVADASDLCHLFTRQHQILFNRGLIAGLPQYLLLVNLMMSIGRLWARPCIWGCIPLGWTGFESLMVIQRNSWIHDLSVDLLVPSRCTMTDLGSLILVLNTSKKSTLSVHIYDRREQKQAIEMVITRCPYCRVNSQEFSLSGYE